MWSQINVSIRKEVAMKNKTLYVFGILCNISLLAYSLFLFAGITGGWIQAEPFFTSPIARIAIFIMMLGTMTLLFANLNICKRRYKGRGYSTLLAWNLFINPIVSISYLRGVWLLNETRNKQRLRIYKGCIYANYGFIIYFAGLIIVSIISTEAGNVLAAQTWIWFIFGLPTAYLYQKNMSVCIAHDTFPRMLTLTFGLIFYNPFYSNRVLKNKWI